MHSHYKTKLLTFDSGHFSNEISGKIQKQKEICATKRGNEKIEIKKKHRISRGRNSKSVNENVPKCMHGSRLLTTRPRS